MTPDRLTCRYFNMTHLFDYNHSSVLIQNGFIVTIDPSPANGLMTSAALLTFCANSNSVIVSPRLFLADTSTLSANLLLSFFYFSPSGSGFNISIISRICSKVSVNSVSFRTLPPSDQGYFCLSLGLLCRLPAFLSVFSPAVISLFSELKTVFFSFLLTFIVSSF